MECNHGATALLIIRSSAWLDEDRLSISSIIFPKQLPRVTGKTVDWSVRLEWYTRDREVEMGLSKLVELGVAESKHLTEVQQGIAVFRGANISHFLDPEPWLKETLYRHVALAPELNNIDQVQKISVISK